MKPHEGRKKRWGDRKDGFLVRNQDPMSRLEPYIMPKKMDGWVLFEDELDIDLFNTSCRVLDFEGNWVRVEADLKKGRVEKLIPLASVRALEIVKEAE